MSTPDPHKSSQHQGGTRDSHLSRNLDELPPSVPILRIFKARAKLGCEGALAENLATTSAQLVRNQPGLLEFLAAGPTNDTHRDFVFATIWRDGEALKAFFGQEWHDSLLPSGYSELIEACSVEHYHLTERFSATAASQ
jgi:heme-degrading monooxygenase HmoA